MNTILHYYNQLDADVRIAITHGVRIVLILIAASVLQSVASRLIRTFREFLERRRGADQQTRVQTLGRVFRYIAAVVIWLLAGMLVLGELGISVAPVLATAGVAGLAVGFGAQPFVGGGVPEVCGNVHRFLRVQTRMRPWRTNGGRTMRAGRRLSRTSTAAASPRAARSGRRASASADAGRRTA